MTTIPGNTYKGWRIRDEYIFRKGNTIKGRYVKRKGGYYNLKDEITKLSDKELQQLLQKVQGDS